MDNNNMTHTMKNWHMKFDKKFQCMSNILEINDNKNSNDIYEKIRNKFDLTEASYLVQYYSTQDDKQRRDIIQELSTRIKSKNIISDMTDLIKEIEDAQSTGWNSTQSYIFHQNKQRYNEVAIKHKPTITDMKICPDCKSSVNVYEQFSQLRCSECPYTFTLEGTTFDDAQSKFAQENNIAKGAGYEAARHFNNHLDKILGLKYKEIPERVHKKIKKWFVLNNIEFIRTLKYYNWRQILKDIKETKFNDYIPHIMSHYKCAKLGWLEYSERKRAEIMFEIIIDVYEQIKEESQNIKYYPFFIAKIIEIILEDPKHQQRKQYFLSNVHFQEETTIEYNDAIWKKICDAVPLLHNKFKPTNKNKIMRR